MTDHGSAVELLADELDAYARGLDGARVLDSNRHAWLEDLARLRGLARQVGIVADDVESMIAASLPAGRWTEIAGRAWTATRERRRRGWDHDRLLQVVLDSRRIDPDTGEIAVDETPVEKLRAVYGLRGNQARVQALRSRGIDPDAYCTVEVGRLRLRERR